MVEIKKLNENSEQGHNNETRNKKQKKYFLYVKIVIILLIGYPILSYLLNRFSLLEFLGFATGCLIGLLILFTVIEIRDRQKQ
jgi:hypothetical protein